MATKGHRVFALALARTQPPSFSPLASNTKRTKQICLKTFGARFASSSSRVKSFNLDHAGRQFEEEGFYIARGLYSQDEVGVILESLEQNEVLMESFQYGLQDNKGGKTKLTLWSRPGRGTIGNVCRGHRIITPLEAFLGGPVFHYHTKILMKKPREGGVWNWHQDYGYWYKDYFLTPDMATVIIALDDATTENGCIRVMSGSHKLGRINHDSVGDQQGCDLERVAEALQRFKEVDCELSRGDALFFHSNLLHTSQGNHSDKRRLLLGLAYTRSNNLPFKNPPTVLACHDVMPAIEDDALLRDGVIFSNAQDLDLMAPEVGPAQARHSLDSVTYRKKG